MTSHKSAFNNKNKAQNKRKYCRCALFFSGAFFFGSSCGLSLYQRARYCPPSLPAGGALLCLSDNHWNQIQVLIIIHLPNVSPLVSKPTLPLARSAFPRAPRHIPPTARTLWITLNLKGCKARYQRVIHALVSFMRWSHWRDAWSEQRVNSRPRR